MPKKVFISYSWDSKEHQEWVVTLTNKLRSTYGVDAKCDVLLDKPNLFSMMVQEANVNDKIIIVDTKRYTEKADNEQGGVGYETRLFYNFFQKQPQNLIVIKRGNCELLFYLNGWNYLDFTSGVTEGNLDALVLKINDEAPYIMPPITKSPRAVKGKIAESALDGIIISDLRVATPQGKDEYLKEEFETANKTISDLLQQTKQRNPDLTFEVEKREVNEPSGTSILSTKVMITVIMRRLAQMSLFGLIICLLISPILGVGQDQKMLSLLIHGTIYRIIWKFHLWR